MILKKMPVFAAIIAIIFLMTSCGIDIPEFPEPGTGTLPNDSAEQSAAIISENNIPESLPATSGVITVGEFYGSYLTMYTGHAPAEDRNLPFVRVFRTFDEIEAYYDATSPEHVYARLFTTTMASFDDDFLRDHDVLILVINEPSSYINHTASPIEISSEAIRFDITRHEPEASPLLDTEYHLIFTGAKGDFDTVGDQPIEINFEDVVDRENSSAYDADLFRLYNPEFVPFCYRADAISGNPGVVVDAIDGYEELVYFYDKYCEDYDLDYEFKDKIGTLYSWDICERYVLLAMLIPCADETEPEVSEIFVNNLQIYATVTANEAEAPEIPKAGYLVLCGIERRDLIGADLNVVYLSVDNQNR